MDAKLILENPTSSLFEEIGISNEIPLAITLSIADVREPAKRNSTFSKTLSIPGSKDANILFEHIFDVNTDLNNFNPNLKTPCKYFVKGEKIFDGDLQLLRIKKKGIAPYESIIYECSVIGRLSDVFLNLGDALLEDLDFSDLNHVFTFANRNWTPTLGTGYTYPMIDYGVTGGCTEFWDFKHFKPAIFETEYIDRIFTSIGKTYTSTYLASTYANSIIIPDVNEGPLKMTPTQVNALSFYAGKTVDTVYTIPLTYYSVQSRWVISTFQTQSSVGTLVYNDDVTGPFYDGGNNYNTSTYVYTCPADFGMSAITSCDFEIQLNGPAGTASSQIQGGTYGIRVDIYNSGYGVTVQTSANTSGPTTFNVTAKCPNTQVFNGYQFWCRLFTDDPNILATQFFNSFGVPITTGTASISITQKSTSWYSASSGDWDLPIGYTVAMNQTIPKNVKQIDFLMSVIKSENLYIELDLTDTNNYIIEQRDDFFIDVDTSDTSTFYDWTDKWDYRRDTTIIPMGELDFRKYIFSYKTDGDKFNKLYREAFGEVYGTEEVFVNNDFIKGEKKNELIFAATPIAGNAVNTLVTPVLAQIDGLAIKPMACQIRRLYWGGLISTAPYYLRHSIFPTALTPIQFDEYPFAGHVNNPYNPTIDLCWDNPKQLYYSYPAQVYTNNNLYVRNYQKFIEQITSENSKIVIMWMYLKPTDISNFTFRKKIWIHDSYYIVNKIIEYDPQEEKPTQVEFLRLIPGTEPVIEVINIWENGTGSSSGSQYSIGISGGGVNPNFNNSNPDGFANGYGNANGSTGSNIIGGENNIIESFNG